MRPARVRAVGCFLAALLALGAGTALASVTATASGRETGATGGAGTVPANAPGAACIKCHAETVDLQRYAVSVHGALECSVCHGDPVSAHKGAAAAQGKCETCHARATVAYRDSVHAALTGEQGKPAATCSNCHGSHYIMPAGYATSPVSHRSVSNVCLQCHQGRVARSYVEYSFHGTAYRLGYEKAPSCVTCHGYHDIRGPEDPASSVAPENLARTCAKCHRAATANMARGKEHVTPADKAEAYPLYVAWKFFVALIIFDTLKEGPIAIMELWRRLRSLTGRRGSTGRR